MSSNATSICSEEWFIQVETKFYYQVFFVIFPVLTILTLPGHTLIILVFYQQYKEEKAYAYQLFLLINEVFCLTFTILWDFVSNILPQISPEWFPRQYWL